MTGQYTHLQKGVHRGLRALLFCACFLLLALTHANAATTVRTGYVPSPEFFTQDNYGRLSGSLYAYMDLLTTYCDLKFTYHPYHSREACVAALQNGEIDLMLNYISDGAGDETVKSASLALSRQPVAKSTLFLALPGSSTVRPWRIGIAGNMHTDLIAGTLQEWNLHEHTDYVFVRYERVQDMHRDAEHGGLNTCIENTATTKLPRERTIILQPTDMYFLMQAENEALRREINHAQLRLLSDVPATRLTDAHLIKTKHDATTHLSERTIEYLRSLGTLRILVLPGEYPYASFQDGKAQGVYIDLCTEIANALGLKIEFVSCRDRQTRRRMLLAGEGDIELYSPNDVSDLSDPADQNIHSTIPLTYLDYSAVVAINRPLPAFPVLAVAAENGHFETIRALFPTCHILPVNTYEEAFRAVKDGSADMTFAKTLIVQHALNQGGFDLLERQEQIPFSFPLTFAVRADHDPRLLHALNTEIAHLDPLRVSQIMRAHYVAVSRPTTLRAMIMTNPIESVVAIALFAVLITGGLLWQLRQRQRYAQRIWRTAYLHPVTEQFTTQWLTDYMPKLFRSRASLIRAGRLYYAVLVPENLAQLREIYHPDILMHGLHSESKRILKAFPWITTNAVNMEYTQFHMLCTVPEGADVIALFAAMQQDITNLSIGDNKIAMRVRLGVLPIKDVTETPHDIMRRGMIALRQAKAQNKSVHFYDEAAHWSTLLTQRKEALMHKALKAREFIVFLQPKYDLCTHKVIGAEALVRWDSPELGLMLPKDFIALFENNGFIIELDYYILEDIMRRQASRIADGMPYLPISVNQSGLHCTEEGYLSRMQALVDKYRLPADAIELEITETTFIDYTSQNGLKNALSVINSLKAMGYTLSMDDFCTGYSSIAMLEKLPMNVMKIDRSMLLAAMESQRARDILSSVAKLGEKLGMTVIVEGIDTPAHEKMLLSLGCRYGQGFLFGMPMPADDFKEFFVKHS